jgi:inosine/xanthosine triphosphatase
LIKVYIGSINPVKIECTRQAFQKVFRHKDFVFAGKDASSGVSDQPMSDRETYEGARNRAINLRNNFPDGDFWVGIEGGVESINQDMHAFAWMVVFNGSMQGEARTATFILPTPIKELINQGIELGHADDIVFKRINSKQKDGAVGILTHGLIDRINYYEPAIILALIPFLHKDLY